MEYIEKIGHDTLWYSSECGTKDETDLDVSVVKNNDQWEVEMSAGVIISIENSIFRNSITKVFIKILVKFI